MSFRVKTILGIALIETVFLSVIVWSSLSYLRTSSVEDMVDAARSNSALFVAASQDAVISQDLDSLATMVDELLRNTQILYVRIFSHNKLLMESGDVSLMKHDFYEEEIGTDVPDDGVYDVTQPILISGYSFGRVEMGFNVQSIETRLGKASFDIILIAVMELLVSGFFSFGLGIYLTKYLTLIQKGNRELERGNFGYQVRVSGNDELAKVASTFNDMSRRMSKLSSFSDLQNKIIRERESLVNSLLQNMPFGLLLCNIQKNEVVLINTLLCDLMGFKEEACVNIVGAKCCYASDFMKNKFSDPEKFESYMSQTVESFKIKRSDQFLLNNGLIIDIDFMPVDLGDEGSIYSLCIFQDVTERNSKEMGYIQRSNELSAVVDLSPAALLLFDSNGYIKRVNKGFSDQIRLPVFDLVGKSVSWLDDWLRSSLLPGSFLPEVDYTKSQGLVTDSLSLRVCEGDVIYLERIICFEDDSSLFGGVIYFRDVSEQKKLELMKSEFLSTAAHELRTPMANVYGYSELLLNTQYSPDLTNEFIEIIHKQAGRLVSILNDLLDLARIEANVSNELHYEVINLQDLIRESVNLFTGEDSSNQIQIDIKQTLPLMCDRNKIMQVMSNVLGNALKYTTENSKVVVSLQELERKGVRGNEIHIKDQGIGMSQEQLQRIFERFYRADSSGSIPGTGLGMSIVKEIIGLHGGEIDIESKVGEGTTVSIWLPLQKNISITSGVY